VGIVNINPYRYRSYRLDVETGLYYLNARYYDPSIGRFISADSINYLDPSSEQRLNLYAYCGNNPVMYVDPNGTFLELIIIPSLLVTVTVALVLITVAHYMEDANFIVNSNGIINDFQKITQKIDDAKKSIAIAIVVTLASVHENRQTGTYVIQYESGHVYVGKGGYLRATTSALFQSVIHDFDEYFILQLSLFI
jgi:RHS repeat-associated protein